MEEKIWTSEEVVIALNQMQAEKWIKITNYSPLELSLRVKLEKEVEPKMEFMTTWTDLWSKKYSGIKPRGYYIGMDLKSNTSRMKNFRIDYPQFSEELIMKATKKYLNEKSLINYDFCMKSAKFIWSEENGSTLYQYCKSFIEGEEEIKEKVESI